VNGFGNAKLAGRDYLVADDLDLHRLVGPQKRRIGF